MLREAVIEDFDKFYKWVNDPEVRQNAFVTKQIEREEYWEWYKQKLADQKVRLFVVEINGVEVGQVRLESHDEDGLIVYSVDRAYRGQGFGTYTIAMIEDYLKKNPTELTYLKTLTAYVKKKNYRSIKVFERHRYEIVYHNSKYVIFRKRIMRENYCHYVC